MLWSEGHSGKTTWGVNTYGHQSSQQTQEQSWHKVRFLAKILRNQTKNTLENLLKGTCGLRRQGNMVQYSMLHPEIHLSAAPNRPLYGKWCQCPLSTTIGHSMTLVIIWWWTFWKRVQRIGYKTTRWTPSFHIPRAVSTLLTTNAVRVPLHPSWNVYTQRKLFGVSQLRLQ